MQKLRFGILGTGHIVPRFVAALGDSAAGEAFAIASRDVVRASAIAETLGIPRSYGSYEALLADPAVDVVYVALINNLHYAFAKMALMEGKHVVCEKPFTLAAAQAEELFALAQQKGLFIAEAQKMLFLPVILEVRRRLQRGDFGAVRLIDLSNTYQGGMPDWTYQPDAGGGVLWGGGCYGLALVQYLLGQDIDAYSGLATGHPVDTQCAMVLRAGTTLATNRQSIQAKANDRALILCEAGHIRIPDYWKARTATLHDAQGHAETLNYPCAHEMVYEIDHFCECILQGLTSSPVATPALTRRTLQILEDFHARQGAPAG